MPSPLDAEHAAAHARPGPRPTPVPRSSSEALTVTEAPSAVPVPADELEVAPDELVPEPQGVDVWALVHRAQQGDAEAFGELYDHYVTMVHRYVYHRVGDRATAEDVTSETFV
ncbi:MAG: polymerase, sigma-24 subunit, subfamily, partial [Blastococcus sp.]|nr:polymerase, sigma-24 subunit, subfamily [Blastococcus sp.]